MRALFLSLMLTSCIALHGCTPAKGYVGPDLPKDQISLIKTESDSGVSLSAESVDGIDLGFGGIEVLPGEHEFYVEVAVSEEPRNCQPYSEFDSIGYRNCQRKNRYCDCFDYVRISERCDQKVNNGTCRGSVKTQAGRRYVAAVELEGLKPRLRFREEGTSSGQSSGECRKADSSDQSIERYIGSGRYDANRAGIYNCY